MNENVYHFMASLREQNIEFVVVTLVNTKGSSPQEIGAKIIVGVDGLMFGTIGGGKLEEKAIGMAKEMLVSTREFEFVDWNLQSDVKMTCGGVVSLFFEKNVSQFSWQIAVFGAGHVAQELIRLLLRLDCQITCIDPRLDWLQKLPNSKKLKKIHTEDMKDVLVNLNKQTFIVSVTMGHAYDLPIVAEAMKNFNFPYIGVIGSESKSLVLKNNLLNLEISKDVVSKLFCPIGELLGSNQPAEIAVSIVSQLLKIRDHKIK